MNEKVAAYVQSARSKGLDDGAIADKMRSIGVGEEEIAQSLASSGSKAQEMGESLKAAAAHSADMFLAGEKPNFEPFGPAVVLYYIIDYVAITAILAAVLSALVLFLRMTPLILLIPVAFFLVCAAYSKMFVDRFRFRLDDRLFYVRKGVFASANTLLPYENIQDIHVVQSITERLLGLSSAIIFTATTSGAGAEWIPGLPRDGAERLKAELFRKMKEVKNVTD
ncbi:MAG: PH domain-containing protein [Candidatus Altiarchaeota archaeon]